MKKHYFSLQLNSSFSIHFNNLQCSKWLHCPYMGSIHWDMNSSSPAPVPCQPKTTPPQLHTASPWKDELWNLHMTSSPTITSSQPSAFQTPTSANHSQHLSDLRAQRNTMHKAVQKFYHHFLLLMGASPKLLFLVLQTATCSLQCALVGNFPCKYLLPWPSDTFLQLTKWPLSIHRGAQNELSHP